MVGQPGWRDEHALGNVCNAPSEHACSQAVRGNLSDSHAVGGVIGCNSFFRGPCYNVCMGTWMTKELSELAAMHRNEERRAKRREDKGLTWDVAPLWVAVEHRDSDGRALVITLGWEPSEQHFKCAAVETPADLMNAEDVFADHAHAVIGVFDEHVDAKNAATDYAVKWLRGGKVAEPCECEAITPAD